MLGLSAEQAYVFRHALARDAAYELQLPAERAGLHRLAAELIEALCGADEARLGVVAAEIAEHLRAAGQEIADPRLQEAERRFTLMGARHAEANWDHDGTQRLYGRLADIGNPAEQGQALQILCGSLRLSRRGPRAMRTPARKLLRLARQTNNPGLVAKALTILALDAPDTRRMRLERMAYRVASAAGSWMPAGLALGNMAMQYRRAGDYRRASALLRRAVRLSLRAGNQTGAGHFLGALAGVLQLQGRDSEALQAARQAVQTLLDAGNVVWLPYNLRTLARICAQQGLWDEADRAQARIGEAFEKMRQHSDLAHVQFERALLQLEQGNVAAARELWAQGLAVVGRHGPSLNNAEPEERMRRRCAELGTAPLDTA